MNPWLWHVPILIAMAVLIIVFFLLEGYVRKLRPIGISSVIAFVLFFVSISIVCVPAFSNITGVKMVGYVISFLVNWPMVVVFKILNSEHLSIRSYNLIMLIEIGKFIINVFVIYGIIRLVKHTLSIKRSQDKKPHKYKDE